MKLIQPDFDILQEPPGNVKTFFVVFYLSSRKTALVSGKASYGA
jgi:hypothetical protein